jgi:cupin 2 domain-containing protein
MGAVKRGRLAGPGQAPSSGERSIPLATVSDVRVEQIVSSAEPDPVLYDQAHTEWVVVLDGSAALELENEIATLEAGDWILIPAHVKHRVLRTATGTTWLAVHGPSTE